MADRVLFINIIKQCNMHCGRCYLTVDSRKDSRLLSNLALQKILQSSWAQEGNLTLIWEGGEASLAGRSHFLDLMRQAKETCPQAKQTMVSNLFSMPNWLIEASRDYFDSKIETTFALDGKFSLSMDREMFLEKFAKNFKKAASHSIQCPINLELNDHTVELGPKRLVDYLETLIPCRVELDISVDFESFLKDPAYTIHGYPLLPLTTSYRDFTEFVKAFWEELGKRSLTDKITSSLIEEMREKKQSTMFAVQRGSDFLTINPDGSLTTNPLFSDLQPTFIGNVLVDSVEDLLSSRKRMQFIRHELRKTMDCMKCPHLRLCSGGPSHAPTFDGSGECSGMKGLRDYFGAPA